MNPKTAAPPTLVTFGPFGEIDFDEEIDEPPGAARILNFTPTAAASKPVVTPYDLFEVKRKISA